MELFEIHITGDKNIIDVLISMNIKSLHIELRNPVNEAIGVEYMSSYIQSFKNYETCKKWVDSLVDKLLSQNIEIYRVKIECPFYYKHYQEMSLYLECHFPTTEFNKQYPFIYNVKSNKYASTDRVYLKSEYSAFLDKWLNVPNTELEYCLFDDNIRNDNLWVKSFSNW